MRVKARWPRFSTLLLAAMLVGGVVSARAQLTSSPPASGAGIYTCIDDQGRRITSDRPIPSCTAKEQRVLNKDGSLKAVYPPILTVDERTQPTLPGVEETLVENRQGSDLASDPKSIPSASAIACCRVRRSTLRKPLFR